MPCSAAVDDSAAPPSDAEPGVARRAHSPGRVNLIGDHTDYNAGVALPMAIDLGTTVTFVPDGGGRVVLRSDLDAAPADVDVDVALHPERLRSVEPRWARYVAAVVAAVRPGHGGQGTVTTTLPVGAGLSSSAALEVATALVLGFEGDPLTVARTCQRAEQAATGVPTGIMDQLVVSVARPGHALYVDFADMTTRHVAVPEGVDVVVVHCGEARSLDRSAYATRRVPSARPPPTGLAPWARSTRRWRRPFPTPCCGAGPATWRRSASVCGTSPAPSHGATWSRRGDS